ncbi:protein NO VEIN-like [Rosa sericea]
MAGYPHHFRPSSGDWNWAHPPPQLSHPQFPHPNFPPQNPTNLNIYPPQPSAFPPPQPPPPQPSNPNFPLQHPIDVNIFPANHYGHSSFSNYYPTPTPSSNFSLQNPNPTPHSTPPFPPQSFSRNPNEAPDPPNLSNSARHLPEDPREVLEKIDRAVEKLRDDLVAAGKNVSAWKVLQSALLMLNVDAETCLGLKIEQVPSLHRLMVTEGRINAFIHCFVGVRTITSLYDLEVAICKNEDIEQFEELGLGPLLRHPLVLQYFSVDSETTEVFKISSEEILHLLSRYLKKPKVKENSVEGFLDFIVTKRPVAGKEKLGIRIFSLGVHASAMREAKASERAALWKSLQELKQKSPKISRRKAPIFSSLKKRLDKHFCAISQQSGLCSVVNGKEDTLVSSRSKDEGINDYLHDDKGNDHGTGGHIDSLKSLKSSDREGKCSYLSEVEERSSLMSNHPSPSQKHNESNGSVKKKRKYENLSCPISVPSKLCKREKVEQDALPTESDSETKEVSEMLKLDLSIANNLLRMFITTWKEACKEQPVAEVLWAMLRSCNTKYRRTKRIMAMFSTYPLVGLLNVAVSSIKCGMWENMFDTSQTISPRELDNTVTDNYPEHVEQSIKDAPPVSTEHATEHGQTSFCLKPNHLDRPRRWRKIQRSRKKLEPENGHICYLCHQEGHVKRSCPLRQQTKKSSYEPQSPQQLAQYSISGEEVEEKVSAVVDGVSVKEIIRKVATYFETPQVNHGMSSNGESLPEKIFIYFRKLCNCELWLTEEFSVKEFRSLGYGEFMMFLEKYACLLPPEMCKFLKDDSSGKFPLEVCMLPHYLVVLVSQALNNLWEDQKITKLNISSLLGKQFPALSFHTIENGSVEDFKSIVGKHKDTAISKCVLFSMTICGTSYTLESLENCSKNAVLKSSLVSVNSGQKISNQSVASKEAIAVLLRAPMMSDLNLWSHWDLLFAPSLGPLVPWLLNEVNTDELLCLVTKDGKVIRLDHSATVDSFSKAALQGSSFQTAVKMLSLFSLVGGEKHVPVSLLKFHVQRAFEVIFKTYLDGMEVYDKKSSLNQGTVLCGQKMVVEIAAGKCSNLHRAVTQTKIAESVISHFFLDCLGYLPAEFRSFAADVLLSGMRSVFKHAASAILDECIQIEQRLILHEVGLSLGIVEWISDYHVFSSLDSTDSFMSEDSGLNADRDQMGSDSKYMQNVSKKLAASEQSMAASVRADEHKGGCADVSRMVDGAGVSDAGIGIGIGYRQHPTNINEHEDAFQVIESIRRDEFGLDSSPLTFESIVLKKQHARLGRALHCLSQELYSQDSHFLLELVQNADDNTYPTNIEPTLAFILQESGIVVLNNERGFSAQNIRALCDVGNSTKKGSSAGYIGQKGIGFKSVFRVTDAPEIHSNGFHIKFDTSEGQIGLILPTVVPPCNLELFRQLTSSDIDKPDCYCWKTCIVLPFRSKVSDGTVLNHIMNMFSDLHPSLLLFLHRLKCIRFRNLIDDSLTVMRKEIVGDGIVKVSHGNSKMTWFVVSQKLHSDNLRSDVQTTEISIAFTLKESDKGIYRPDIGQQPVFAFLPLRTYGLKFIVQGDFVLPSSREEVDGDSPWNQWLLSEFPGLFVDAEKSFCSLPCFKENPGTAVAAYMSFVPLVGEVHGFFSSLPRLIISKLRMSNCLLQEGEKKEWVPPCKVLRNWSKQARSLLPDGLLHEHLGLGFLDKDIVLPDPLARVLGIAEYGPTVLLQVMASLCGKQDGLKSMGMGWMASLLSELYAMSFKSSVETSLDSGIEMGFLEKLQKIPFIPLSDGTYGAVVEGPIWLQFDAVGTGFGDHHGLESFPKLYAKLRIVSPELYASSADMPSMDVTPIDKVISMLHRIGVQRLSAHEILKAHILPAISDDRITVRDEDLMTDYICFAMVHLQSSCSDCHAEREYIISELQNKAYILTNNGFKRPAEASIHFSKEFGNPVDISRLIDRVNLTWDEVDISYLKHPVAKSLPNGLMKWRDFFQKIGIVDFVKVVQVEKGFTELSEALFNNLTWDQHTISHGLNATDWESPELVHLLSLLSRDGNRKGCEYLLEVLDKLWDDCYSDRATGYCSSKSAADRKPFKSSFMSTICDVQWVVSGMDDKLHYPKDLYHDSVAVRSILGGFAPFFVPKATSEKFVSDIGFKTRVSLHDALEMLKLWRCENPFRASLAQMSKFYSLIWNEMASSKKTTAEEFCLEPFVFVPYESSFRHEDVVSGTFLSLEEVYWDDSTFFVDQIKEIHHQCNSTVGNHGPINRILSNFYPALHDFFVDICGVHEIPPLRSYLQILLQFSNAVLPSQAANAVFQVFQKWADGLQSGMSAEDIVYLKDSLTRMECTVLPTVQDKWVSLHPSYGLLCWCDDKKLKKQFMHMDGLDFLYSGGLSNDDEEIPSTKMSVLMRTLGIPALSEVVTREAMFNGPTDSSFKAALLDWALPYAQRYLHSLHPDKYSQLKQSGFDILNRLRVVEVQKLSYRNVIKIAGSESKKQIECSCVLQDHDLYTTQESDSHALFMELSRLFFDGKPELHLANFLHMITTMAESGSTEEQIDFFIFNSQKVPKLPDGESVWSLSHVHNDRLPQPSDWRFVGWKAPLSFGYANLFKAQAQFAQLTSVSQIEMDNDSETHVRQTVESTPISVDIKWTIGEGTATTSAPLVLPNSNDLQEHFDDETDMDTDFNPNNLDFVVDPRVLGSSDCSKVDHPRYGSSGRDAMRGRDAMLTGRLGEVVAFKYLIAKAGKSVVRWVNERIETGLPYDIVVGEKEDSLEFIEVKATQQQKKDWFHISMREWQFAAEKGEAFSILHVLLLGNNAARVSVYKNPVKLCHLGKLQLHLSMPRQEKELFLVS